MNKTQEPSARNTTNYKYSLARTKPRKTWSYLSAYIQSKLRQARSVNSKQTSDNLNELQERLRILATKLDNETKKNVLSLKIQKILKELIGLTKSGITTRRKTSRVESSQ